MNTRTMLIALALVAGLLGCVTTGPGGKTSLVLISTPQEVALGAAMAEEIAASEKVLPDQAWQAYLNEVGQKIVAVCDRKDIEYRFTVIESDQFNAFAAPGGYVYFYTGLLRTMDNEAEMAAVMAHEISHVVARHGSKRLQATMGAAMAAQLVLGDNSSEVFQTAVGVGMNLLFAGYSRDAEREADAYGMEYMVRAGYDPRAMETMFLKMARQGSESNSFEQFFSSHPDTQERINNAKQAIQAREPISGSLRLGTERYRQMLGRL
jgi:predicted Zn-dependent protease